MEAKELRIGNAIWLVDKNKAYIIQDGHDIDECENNDMVKPIPITEEILLKCKCFKPFDNGHTYSFGLIVFTFINGEISSIGDNNTHILALHGFQNVIFDLTGKELDVSKLFE